MKYLLGFVMQSFRIELAISPLLEQIINGWFRSDSHRCLCSVVASNFASTRILPEVENSCRKRRRYQVGSMRNSNIILKVVSCKFENNRDKLKLTENKTGDHIHDTENTFFLANRSSLGVHLG